MRGRTYKRTNIYTKGIAWLFLFVFGSVFLVEVLHSHVTYQRSEVSISQSADKAAVNQYQSSCNLCDYFFHQNSQLLPVAYHFAPGSAKPVQVIGVVQTQFINTVDDVLRSSGNSPPLV